MSGGGEGIHADVNRSMRRNRIPAWIAAAALAATLPAGYSSAEGREAIPATVAAFDNYDSAGEAAESTSAHAARVEGFAGLIHDGLAATGRYRLVPLECPQPPCSAGSMAPADLVAAARASGARVLVYGGIHKMSTLIQMGKVQALDLEGDRLLLDQAFSFRGDTDEAFRRAAQFIVRYLEDAAPTE